MHGNWSMHIMHNLLNAALFSVAKCISRGSTKWNDCYLPHRVLFFLFPPPFTCWSFAVKIKSYCFSFLVPPGKMSIGFGPKCPGSSFVPCTAGLVSALTRGPLGFCSFTSSLLWSKCQSWGRGKGMLRNECAVWNQRQLPDTPTLTNDISFCTLRK